MKKTVLSALLVCLSVVSSCQTRSLNDHIEDNSQLTAGVAGEFMKWNNGTNATEPSTEIHVPIPGKLVVFRQSLRTSFEGPFLHLILGPDKALLIDTGAGGTSGQLVAAVKKHLGNRKLFFTNSHGHNDHVAGNSAFATFATRRSFGGSNTTFDLGDRTLEILSIPGHTSDHIAVWDPATRVLFTGDTVYPGNLYALDFPRFQSSIKKLADFVANKQVDMVLGAHIEIQNDGQTLFARGNPRHPNERHLEMSKDDILAIHNAVKGQPSADCRYRGKGWMVRNRFPADCSPLKFNLP